MNRDDETVCTACRSGVCSQHQPVSVPPRTKEVDDAFDAASGALCKAVTAAPGGDEVACVSIAFDMKTCAWMINSNIKAEGFVRFLEDALSQVRRNLPAIQAVSDELSAKATRN